MKSGLEKQNNPDKNRIERHGYVIPFDDSILSKDNIEIIKFLKEKTILFDEVSDDVIDQLVPLSEIEKFDKGEEILLENTQNSKIYFLMRGIVGIYKDSQFVIKLQRKGDIFGEMSLISNKPTSATVLAETQVTIFSIKVREIESKTSIDEKTVKDALYKLYAVILADKLAMTTYKAIGFEHRLKEQNENLLNEVKERKQIEKALKISEEKYRSLVEGLSQSIFTMNRDGVYLFLNTAAAKQLGGKQEDFIGKTIWDIFPKEVADNQIHFIRQVIDSQEFRTVTSESLVLGEKRWYEARIHPYHDGTGKCDKALTILTNITERKQVENRLRKSNERYQALFEGSRDCIYLLDSNGNLVEANHAASALFGYNRVEIIKLNVIDLVDEGQVLRITETLKDVLKEGALPQITEFQVRKKDGQSVWVEVSASVINHDNEPVLIQALARDITARKKLEMERARLASVVEQSYDNIVITDLKGIIEYVNPSFERNTGYSRAEVIGENPRLLQSGEHDHEFYRNIWDKITTGDVWTGNLINRHKNGSLFEESATIFPVLNSEGRISNYAAVKRDITEQNKIEKQLIQAQKLEAIGTLSSGIAHDFNNILGVIFGFTQLSKRKLPESPEYHRLGEYLDKIYTASFRAKELIDQILTFSRKGDYRPQKLDLVPLIKESIKFLRATIPTTISIILTVDPDINIIYGDATQFHQVIMNLCTNASHAMQEKGGTLNVKLTNYRIISEAETQAELKPGDYILLTVSDTGKGMDEKTRQRIFEPFFTTKEQGKGTGLGLSVVHGIVSNHKGVIHVYSQEGSGTTFHVYFPALESEKAVRIEDVNVEMPTGSESILFVDDEIELGTVFREMLQIQGYRVQTTTSSLAALKMVKEDPVKFDLVILDYTMPKINGIELSRQIHKYNRDIPIVLISGLGQQIDDGTIQSSGITANYSKPIDFRELIPALRDILDNC